MLLSSKNTHEVGYKGNLLIKIMINSLISRCHSQGFLLFWPFITKNVAATPYKPNSFQNFGVNTHISYCGLQCVFFYKAKKTKMSEECKCWQDNCRRSLCCKALAEIPKTKSDTLYWFSNGSKLKVISYRTKHIVVSCCTASQQLCKQCMCACTVSTEVQRQMAEDSRVRSRSTVCNRNLCSVKC